MKYIIKGEGDVKHDGQIYTTDDTVDMSATVAAALVESGRLVEVVKKAKPKTPAPPADKTK